MSQAVHSLVPKQRLRVAVYSADASRRTALGSLVTGAGHVVVGTLDDADVIVADGDAPPGEVLKTITLGGADDDAQGVLPRDADANQIDAAIRAVAAGLVVRRRRASEAGFGALRESETQALLTPRELEVLAALSEGMTNKAIARRLDISLHTVKFHVESLFRKLGARTRTEAVTKASERRRRETITL